MDVVTLLALVIAFGTMAAALIDSRRKGKIEPMIAITQGAATLAAAMEAVVGPLRDEVIELRQEVIVLRKSNAALIRLLRTHEIPFPDND